VEPVKEGGLEMLTKDVLVGPKPDNIFRSLVKFNVEENYFRRTVAGNTEQEPSVSTWADQEGDEIGHRLIGVIMLAHREDIKGHTSGRPITYDTIQLSELADKLVQESKRYTDKSGVLHKNKDGGYIVELKDNGNLVITDKKHLFHNYITKSLNSYNTKNHPEIDDFLEIAEKLVPSDFSSSDASYLDFGSKTQMAVAAGDSYVIKETEFGGAGVGKVIKVGKMLDGVEAEFFLYKIPNSESNKYAHLDEESFFNPEEKVIGILRTYKPGFDKSERNEYVIKPEEVGISQEFIRQQVKVKPHLRVAVETYGMQAQL